MSALLTVAVAVAGGLAAAGPSSAATLPASSTPASDVTLTLYNAQHEDLANEWVDAFTAATGIGVEVRSGDDFELANLIAAEGASSPADVFITENSPAMNIVREAGLFAPVDPATLAQVPAEAAASDASWTGIAGRSTVLVYNTSMLAEADLPTSIMDLAGPEWKGKVGIAAGGADFQAIVSAVLATQGEEATATWLDGLSDNAEVYQGNGAVMRAVNAGEIPAGVIYHYYWYQDQAESGENSSNTQLHFFGNQDPGAFVSLSGGGVLASSAHPDEAQQLLAFITSPEGQNVLADSTALEYPIGIGIEANPALKPLSELDPPVIDPSTLNGPATVQLMQDAGLL